MSTVQVQKESGRWSVEGGKPRGTLAALVRHTLSLQTRGILIWGFVVGLYSAAIVASYKTFGSPAQIEQIMQAYPEDLLEAFGMTDMTSVEGYLDGQIFILAPLALAFFTILAAANAIAGAEERGSIDVLLGNPLPRWQLVVGNFVATALSLLGILAIAGLMSWVTATLMDIDLSFGNTVEGFLNLWPISLAFGGLAMLCSALFHRRALAIAIPGFVLFAMYLLNTLGNISEDLEDYQPASAFHYYGSAVLDGIDWADFVGLTAVAVFLVLLAVLAFRRREIYT
ncbi:MAG: ABC transporter permease [Actinomycetota bacterium]|nr:ABC transporter permease [Actinomycetota bacterium]HZY65795.1 ABC transporter permease subunit [Rubrobacteraceae bacterium]